MRMLGSEIQDWEYDIKGRAKVHRRNVNDIDPHAHNKELNYERTMVYIVPEMNGEGQMFLRAWLPETKEEHFEIAMFILSPIFSPCRGAVMRANEHCDKPHIVVMSKGVEEEIIKLRDSGLLPEHQSIQITIHSQNDDSMADGMKESSGSYDVIS